MIFNSNLFILSMTLTEDYLEITKKHKEEYGENTMVLMQNGAFFEVYALKDKNENIYGSNIVEFGQICDLNVVNKKMYIDNDQVVNAGFKTEFVDKYVKKLQDTGYTIAVYTQSEGPDGKFIRNLAGIFSPGTYFSNDNTTMTNNSCCIWIEMKKNPMKTLLQKQNVKDISGSRDMIVHVGVSVIDIYTGQTTLMEFTEQYLKNPTTFDELENFISIHNPSETIIIHNLTNSEVEDVISYANIRSKTFHLVDLNGDEEKHKNVKRALNCEKQTYQTALLSRFYHFADISVFMESFAEKVWATQSFCYLLDFVHQHNPNLVNKIAEPTIESEANRLVLANHSLKQLNIIDDDNYKGKFSSVSKMLNECITPMGKRRFYHDFLNPIIDENDLQRQYDITEVLLKNIDTDYKTIKHHLSGYKDISKIIRQIILQKVSPKSLFQMHTNFLDCGETLWNFLHSRRELKKYFEESLSFFHELPIFIRDITHYLDKMLLMETCKDIDSCVKFDVVFIKSGVDLELDEQVKTLMESQDQLECCRFYFNSIVANYEGAGKKTKSKTKSKSQTNAKKTTKFNDFVCDTDDENDCNHANDNVNENDENDSDEDIPQYVREHITDKNNSTLVATSKRCQILEEVLSKSKSKTVILKYNSTYYKDERQFTLDISQVQFHKQTSTNKTISTSQIDKLCKNVSSMKSTLMGTVSKVYLDVVVEPLKEFQENMENICQFITLIDLLYAKAFIADKYNYCKPEIIQTSDGKSFVDAVDLRHCLIEKIQQSELYVANDIILGDGKTDGVLLYGTNAVGKTSFIRALGISVIMAQAGLYVPASYYKYKPYKCIFTRILGNDNLFKGLSTFAVEMSELRTILRLANKNSLVLGDELCSGTESTSAISIFVAGVQMLHKKQVSFIFATHLHEIVDYVEIKSMENVKLLHMSVVYDREHDCLVYDRKLKPGPGNNMYGLEVCKSLSLPDEFLNMANDIRMKYHPKSQSLLDHGKSHFNAKHIKGMCEKCGQQMASEVHHLQHQKNANDKGIIKNENGDIFHKNHPANLLSVCEKCHDEMHETGKQHKVVKTTKGQKIVAY
jgi:DNA mismatch repair protein MutS